MEENKSALFTAEGNNGNIELTETSLRIAEYKSGSPGRNTNQDINIAAKRLFDKLSRLETNDLEISDYNKVYFRGYQANLDAALKKYSYLLSLAMTNTPLEDFCLIDYGGGTGILAMLAKELKIQTVIYNDIYEQSCHDAETLACAIGNKADYYVHGDIDDVINFCHSNDIKCNSIASYDVIEHIYDVETYFSKLNLLDPDTVVMASGANASNPYIRRIEMRTQKKDEYQQKEAKYGHKNRDSIEAFLILRRTIILEHLSAIHKKLSEKEIVLLSKNTRGLIKSDIMQQVDNYIRTGELPPLLPHPTNTCDPLTGNWSEHLMDPHHLANILNNTGYTTKVLSGYYYTGSPNIAKKILITFLNKCIQIFGLMFSPYYIIYGKRIS